MGQLKASKHIVIDDDFIDKIKDRLSKDMIIPTRNYTAKEAAVFLNLSDQTIRKYIRDGVLKAFKIDQKTYAIEGAELEKYVNQKKKNG